MSELHLPFPPRSKPRPEDNERPEEVVVTLLSGKKQVGQLRRFDAADDTLALYDEHNDAIIEIRMDEIKLLHLVDSRQFALSRDHMGADPDDFVLPPERQDYQIEFTDGSFIDGETYGHVSDEQGIHLFLVQPFSQYSHQYIPFNAVKHHRIGPYLGQMLVDGKLVTPEQLDEGLQAQQELRSQRIGEYLTSNEIVTQEQLEQALQQQQSSPNLKLGEALLQDGVITEEQLDEALRNQKADRSRPLGEILIGMGLVDQQHIKRTLASKLGIPFVNLRKFDVDPRVIDRVPVEIVRKHTIIPLCMHQSKLVVAVEDPMNRVPLEDMRFHTKTFIEPVLAEPADILWAIEQYYGSNIDALARELDVDEAEDEQLDIHADVGESDNTLVRLVNKIIVDGYKQGASDIHIEPYPGRNKTIVRFRIDGTLVPYVELPYNYRNAVVSRIKIMCDLDISERRKPQDGKINFRKFGGANIELRVATVPTSGGLEDVVLRILANGEPIPIDQLALSPNNFRDLETIISKPYGLFLVCGPTGSGKTTTLHSVLGRLNKPEKKIWTAEDPVEITQRGLRQVQINPKINLTFANAMRSFLRADPDIIMVGEMRDEETASIGIEASLTGHLVLSTLHTNSAPESVVRLLDMGMDPFNFADALLGILAQRLTKTLCPTCKRSYKASKSDLEELAREYCAEMPEGETDNPEQETIERWRKDMGDRNGSITLYRSKGCDECGGTGYRGRMGIHELLVASNEVKRLIAERQTVATIFRQGVNEGMRTLKQDGIEKVLQGYTDILQVRAVCIK